MKKILVSITAVSLTLFLAGAAFAASYSSPGEILASLTGKSEVEIYAERSGGKTYGEIAQENGQLEQFKSKMVEFKKEIIAERVAAGTISQAKGEDLKEAIEERAAACLGTPGTNGQCMGASWGGGLGLGRGQNTGMARGMGRNIIK